MKNNDTRHWHPLIFLAVLLSHVVVVLFLIRIARQAIFPATSADGPLIVMLLHDKVPLIAEDLTTLAAISRAHTPTSRPVPDNAIAVPSDVLVQPKPKIDWDLEAETTAQDGIANAEKEKNYRDLSALSAAQLSWLKENHMEPMRPGIQWQHPRFEFDRNSGLPILWINDHCVLVTLMVFCAIGHIEVDGDLFKHMRDPRDP